MVLPRFHEGLHDPCPGACEIPPIVTTAAGRDDAPAAMLVSQPAQGRRRKGVCLLGPAKVRNRVAFEAVRAALHQDELRFRRFQVGLDPRPGGMKFVISGPRRDRDIELGALGAPDSGLVGGAGSRIQVATIFVNIRENEIRIVLKAVKHTVAVMRIDIHVSDALDIKLLSQVFGSNTAVVEDTESGCPVASGVVQSGNRHESTPVVSVDHFVNSAENRADDGGCRVVDAGDDWRIAIIEKAGTQRGQLRHLVDVFGSMKKCQLIDQCRSRVAVTDLGTQSRTVELRVKHVVAVCTERMRIAKAVSCDLLPPVNKHGVAHGRLMTVLMRCSIPDNARSLTIGLIMAQYIYTMNRVAKVVAPKRHILRDISLSFFPGAKIGVLGLNGSGKSTLLRIMAGLDTEIDGEARPQPGIKIGYLPQEPELDPAKDVRGNVEEGLGETIELLNRFNEISNKFAEPMDDDEMNALLEEQGKLQDAIDAAGGWEVDRKLEVAADALRLPPWDADVTKLSGGERRRVALCRLLLSQPDMLLLDEPTNHLDAESVAWLERFLDEYPSTVIAVTHDRYFLDNVAGWILELDRGHGIPWEGNYSSWLEQKEDRLKNEESTEKARQKAMAAELEWVRSNPKGRQAKSKARLRQFDEISSAQYQKRNETNEIYIPPGPRLGDIVLEVDGLKKGFGEKLLIDALSFQLPPGGIVGVIGPNGAGKTTMFRMITGEEKPDAGTLRLGDTVEVASVDQSRDSLNDDKTVWEEISDGLDLIQVGNYETSSRAYVGRFNFRGQDQQKKIGLLSGGERNRVHLAKMLRAGGNLLLLDEPTNDLDVETLRALEEALLDFPGSAIVISHDRWFLDRIATHILAFEGNSEVVWFAGNYADYEADRKRRLGADAANPHRIKYKRLDA